MGVAAAKMDTAEGALLRGAWTAQDIHLADDMCAVAPDCEADKLKRIVLIVFDLTQRPLDQLRLLRLGCLDEGISRRVLVEP